jgi:hypothetical protein
VAWLDVAEIARLLVGAGSGTLIVEQGMNAWTCIAYVLDPWSVEVSDGMHEFADFANRIISARSWYTEIYVFETLSLRHPCSF